MTKLALDTAPDSSPHTRRYFQEPKIFLDFKKLFSAHAEVFPSLAPASSIPLPLLRTRGGISHNHTNQGAVPVLFSAHAEVFPVQFVLSRSFSPLLRTRGGISGSPMAGTSMRFSSPHTRRYFPPNRPLGGDISLFSAHAEVFPSQRCAPSTESALLRTRGGISPMENKNGWHHTSSPHTRRYFLRIRRRGRWSRLFSAHAEVFPVHHRACAPSTTLLRTRGGISIKPIICGEIGWLFSAHAEVFPDISVDALIDVALLRTRGGISAHAQLLSFLLSSSPHTRRYFRNGAQNGLSQWLFSAHAEVFPPPA